MNGNQQCLRIYWTKWFRGEKIERKEAIDT